MVALEWTEPAPTKEKFDYIELEELDLSVYDKPNGKQILAQKLHEIIKNDGFWVITNHGIAQEEIDLQFALAKHFFNDYTPEQKSAKKVNFPEGDYLGHKPAGDMYMFNTDVKTNNELLNIGKFNGKNEVSNDFINEYRDKIEAFSKKSHAICTKILTLFAILLEIDEDYFTKQDRYEDSSQEHLRYMQYIPRSKEDDLKVNNIWSRAHTDFGLISLLYNQLVVGLQLKDPATGRWQYVKPVKNAIVCNIADTLTFYSNGYFKSTVHRVVRPPEDQLNGPRIGIFYFSRLTNNSTIEVVASPLLKRLGLYKYVEPVDGHSYAVKRVQNYFKGPSIEKRDGKVFSFGAFSIKDGFT